VRQCLHGGAHRLLPLVALARANSPNADAEPDDCGRRYQCNRQRRDDSPGKGHERREGNDPRKERHQGQQDDSRSAREEEDLPLHIYAAHRFARLASCTSGTLRFTRPLPGNVLQLCVMSAKRPKPERVGIRELRQNLSVYVKRVRQEGRAYEVTERGEPVARLTPLEGRPISIIERMIAEGRITPATRRFEDLPPPLPMLEGKSLSQILQEMRDEDPR